MTTPQQIVQNFIDNGCPHMKNITYNRVFYTENSASTLVWVEENVVIEQYLLFPNLVTPMHSHPFENQLIFVEGDMTAYRNTSKNSKPSYKTFTEEDSYKATSVLPIGIEHGFSIGERGAKVYNIQIWPTSIIDAQSATIEYLGEPIGPMHLKLMKYVKQSQCRQ